ncbi:DUF1330 domain-containing protein [Tuwongella immobilis]|uniref:DUF1330 domain-containing protein n=1 Tax=Tuwongella immobilis TaxID=692036 RepID=A0A6C2YMZ0_9BACT|nr:DUF1330 domain-containing protein [Tuwongella immobilis]VIP02651.1 Uncharacterized protein OS=Planctomyces limnophilus (strain ATCC 43296 / DSM 3776 / IFAM 1008 / 290) GN=Plim_3966 PE=4 SV=1: DUF1330 [Tuwongella immobilis]VTS02042.1 Uncharacterized protein OS=Planctomyces limnophilus (strain ATCC 43296 / DSM 3776 / IFAM 1008 / 290) GN=Plim_3966 PE=4 SV=1: DUF1330 [Tuwongella immobilis]
MAAYVVFMREQTLDRSELEAYWERVKTTMDGRPLKVLAAYGTHVTLEGPDVEGIVIAEFPTIEEARDWYESPAYQAAAQHRFRGAVYRGVIVQGI